jgi:hypothetical protein
MFQAILSDAQTHIYTQKTSSDQKVERDLLVYCVFIRSWGENDQNKQKNWWRTNHSASHRVHS